MEMDDEDEVGRFSLAVASGILICMLRKGNRRITPITVTFFRI